MVAVKPLLMTIRRSPPRILRAIADQKFLVVRTLLPKPLKVSNPTFIGHIVAHRVGDRKWAGSPVFFRRDIRALPESDGKAWVLDKRGRTPGVSASGPRSS